MPHSGPNHERGLRGFSTMMFLLRTIVACSLFGAVSATSAEGDGYYVIAGRPSNSEIPADNVATTLYRVDVPSKTLDRVRAITTREKGSRFVRLYDDLRIGVVASGGVPGTARFDIIEFDDPARVARLETTAGAGDYFPISVMMFDLPGGPMIGISETIGGADRKADSVTLRTTGLGLDGQSTPLQPEAYFHALSSGGGAGEGLYVPHDAPFPFLGSEEGFRMGVPGHLLDAPFDGPDLSEQQKRSGLVQIINNRSIRLLTPRDSATRREGRTFIDHFVYDKRARTWAVHELESSGYPKAFGPYVAVVTAYDDSEPDQGPRVTVPDTSTPFTKGAQSRSPGRTMTGEIVILDAIRGTKAAFRVDSGDCDVLHVGRRGEVLYRVGDTIFMRHRKGQSFGDPIVWVTHPEIVPAVHWAFRRSKG